MRKRLLFSFFCLFLVNSILAPHSYGDETSHVTVYYFHGDFRCSSCHSIEQNTDTAIKTNFAQDLENGKLIYKVINIDSEENKHYIEDYGLYTKSVVLSLVKNGKELKHKNLDKVWQYLGKKQKFYDYIISETKAFLAKL